MLANVQLVATGKKSFKTSWTDREASLNQKNRTPRP